MITTVRSEEKAEAIRDLNADLVVNTSKEDLVEVLKRQLEEGHSVDVAIDCLGGEIMGKCLPYLTHGARWIMIASMAGGHTEIDLVNIFKRNVRIVGSTLRSRAPEVKAEILASLVRDVWGESCHRRSETDDLCDSSDYGSRGRTGAAVSG